MAQVPKLFVGQVPRDVDEDYLNSLFSEFGVIDDVTVIRDKVTQEHQGCAFVSFSATTPDAVEAAIRSLHGLKIIANAKTPLQVKLARQSKAPEHKLFIGGLPKSMDEGQIRSFFINFGEIDEIHTIRDEHGNSRGCCFLRFQGRDAAVRAIEELHEKISLVAGRVLTVKYADKKKNNRGGAKDPALVVPGAEYWSPQQQQVGGVYPFPTTTIVHHHHLVSAFPHPSSTSPPHSTYLTLEHKEPSIYIGRGDDGSGYHRLGTNSDALLPPPRPPPPHLDSTTAPYCPPDVAQTQATGSTGLSSGVQLVSPSAPPPPAPAALEERPVEGPPGANLFIYHLPPTCVERDLATLFAHAGHVISAKVFIDKHTGQSKGFGFVSFSRAEEAELAIKMLNGFQVGPKRIKVEHKRVRQSSYLPTPSGASPPHGPLDWAPIRP